MLNYLTLELPKCRLVDFKSCCFLIVVYDCLLHTLEKPQPPKGFTIRNVQKRYFVLAWDEPEYGSLYRIHSYTIEGKTSKSENFTVVKTVPYPKTGVTMRDLEPSTVYTIRLSSNNMHGRSEGVLLTQETLSGNYYYR